MLNIVIHTSDITKLKIDNFNSFCSVEISDGRNSIGVFVPNLECATQLKEALEKSLPTEKKEIVD